MSRLPPALVRAVAEEAARDADHACQFLAAIGFVPPAGGPARPLSAELMLDLGAAMRLLFWERAGLTLHLEAGLPPALEAAGEVLLEAAAGGGAKPARGRPWLCEAVLRLAADRLAWTGRRELQADVLIEAPDEDDLVEAMARFLWRHRRAAPGAAGGR